MVSELAPSNYAIQNSPYLGTMRWARKFLLNNFADTALYVSVAGLRPFMSLGQMGVSAVTVYHRSTAAIAGDNWKVGVRFGPLVAYSHIGNYLTTATAHDVNRFECVLPFDETASALPDTEPVVLLSATAVPAVSHATDLMEVTVEGWYSTPQGAPDIAPTPVSLEGYRWPLARRF